MRYFTSVVLVFFCLSSRAQMPAVFAVDGKAIRGYDAVAFFQEGKAVMGHDSLTLRWNEANWLFSTRANLDSFRLHPESYAPQYGGYCAYGVAGGHKSPTEIDTWSIFEGKLYFNYNARVKSAWVKQKEILVPKADLNWPGLRDN